MSERHCGSCTLCCKLLPVRELAKGHNTRCKHQSFKGCAVYHKAGFPPECAVWNCRWLVDPGAAARHRPDRVHYVIDIMPDLVQATNNETGEVSEEPVIQVWIDPAYPDAWRDPALLDYAERQRQPLLIRYGPERAVFAAPPSRTEGHKDWLIQESGIAEKSRTGSRLLDKLAGREAAR
jgi:hypothetical protein